MLVQDSILFYFRGGECDEQHTIGEFRRQALLVQTHQLGDTGTEEIEVQETDVKLGEVSDGDGEVDWEGEARSEVISGWNRRRRGGRN